MLEVARLLAPYRFQRCVVLALTDMEELGSLGARPLVSRLAAEYRVLGAIDLDAVSFISTAPHA